MSIDVSKLGRVALVAVIALLGLAPAASAATRTWAFSDANPLAAASIQPEVATIRALTCQLPAVTRANLALGPALASTSRMLLAADGSRALHRFAVSPDARSYRRAMAAAAAAMLANRPDAALVALLRAHALARRDPRPLVDASVLLTSDRLPNQALALLSAAARLGRPGRSPYGISRLAELDDDRGYALIALHQWRAAGAALSSAYRRSPLLTEAEHNLAVVDVCTGNPGKASALLAAAARRDRFAAAQLIVDKVTNSNVPVASATFDLSDAQTPVLPQLTYPPDAPHGVSASPEFQALDLQLQGKATANAQTVGRLTQVLDTQRLSALTLQRTHDILAAIGNAEQDPSIKPLADAKTAAVVAEGYAFRTYDQGCGGRAAWLNAQGILYAAETKLAIAEYRFDTGLAADLANAVAHQLALAQAQYVLDAGFNLTAVAPAALVTSVGDRICAQQQTAPQQQDVNGSLSDPGVPPCPSGLQGIDFSLNLGLASLSINCEEVSIGASSPGWIGAFGNVSHNFRSGSTTIFAGPQVGANIQAGPFGGGAQAQVGGYITINGQGTITDVGMRGQISAGGSVGPASAYTGTSLDFSFVGSA
jgi:hypothetical protein